MQKIIFLTFITLGLSRLSFKEGSYNYSDIFRSEGAFPQGTKCKKVDAKKLDPLFDDTQVIYSGYLSVYENSNAALGFIFYGSQKAKTEGELQNYPTLIWLNGGPGSSSQLGNFMELGPLLTQSDGSFKKNKYAWNTEYNVIFVDQPIGTGLAYVEKQSEVPTNQKQIGQQFLYALNEFLFGAKGLAQSPWFVFGESYAGKYVPTIAKAILDYNVAAQKKIPLKGVGIGDPFTDPYAVIAEYAAYSFNLGLIDIQERMQVDSILAYGLTELNKGNTLAARDAFEESLDIIITQSGDMNVYNVLQYGNYGETEKWVEAYLNRVDIVNQFGFSEDWKYKISNADDGPVQKALKYDFMLRDVVLTVEEVVKKIPFLIYNGQNDLICSTPGTLRWVYDLKYEKIEEYRQKDFEVLKITGTEKIVGYHKEAGNLELVLINNAGHLVPTDQPEASLQMVTTFVNKHK
ncbi:unnamed protein product (macronuclear) [Paramecium tetraurelia]|uniref:Carboxypeptidase n=1 Tax=Paramecium tetraurelia TaxID=5888 RepID=A0C287_PARTE|nr:uncharacterized protein GSPATT00034381001 [Paramecium tetraurelia]CAK64904.1 unnamed protein product [Paramecium tetraurelia]|eukprot:XP_001432301.1 hypothetical protein (macronuclear) [Paramecium tetraurelia strain d4-2]